MSLGEYLFQVLVYLVAFAGIGVTIFWGLQAIEVTHSVIKKRSEVIDDES